MIVVIQAVVKAGSLFRQRRYLRAVCQEDVEMAVVVIIRHRDSAKNAVDDRLVSGGSVVQNKIHTESSLVIFKADFSSVPDVDFACASRAIIEREATLQ
jgi:hypothetical protein